MTASSDPRQKSVFRATNAQPGRHLAITPANSASKHLSYGRIMLGPNVPTVTFECGGDEVGLVCFNGTATVKISGQATPFAMVRHDAIYIPRGATVVISTNATVDIAELRAPVENQYPLQFIKASDVEADPGLHFRAGGPSSSRELRILLGKNVEAGRLMAGVTVSDPGHWTSWPPHEHLELAEELYVFYDMDPKAFAIQMDYSNDREPEHVEFVRDGDAMIMAHGYHPNVAIPDHTVSFMWVMAADREKVDRRFGVVNVHPDFSGKSSGLDKGR